MEALASLRKYLTSLTIRTAHLSWSLTTTSGKIIWVPWNHWVCRIKIVAAIFITSCSLSGLAILVNTCCEKTQFSYSKFCGHITATSLIDKNLVPVTNRYDNYDYDLCASFMHGYVFFFVLFGFVLSGLGRWKILKSHPDGWGLKDKTEKGLSLFHTISFSFPSLRCWKILSNSFSCTFIDVLIENRCESSPQSLKFSCRLQFNKSF